MMRTSFTTQLCLLACCACASLVQAAPVSIDGVLGAEWSGANIEHVTYNPSAPTGNFNSPTPPTNETNEVAYEVLTRGDADYFYVGLTTSVPYAGALNWANLYFSTTLGGSNIGFETTNNRAFIPGVPGYYPYTTGSHDIHLNVTSGSVSTPSVIEFAAPWEVFTNNSLGLSSLTPPTSAVRLNLSQSFGYSVAGGQPFYGDDRLGIVALPVPEPASLALLGLAACGLVGARRRK